MEKIVLYVKSKKISIGEISPNISGEHGVSSIGGGTSKTFTVYKPEDEEALSLLRERRIAHEVVDLATASFITRMRTKTPTLKIDDRKVVGLENIKQSLAKNKF
jgi:hypothetical protein